VDIVILVEALSPTLIPGQPRDLLSFSLYDVV
jgi:hypothetical protein